jgi:nucleoside-diphosphate-sugar epimerase
VAASDLPLKIEHDLTKPNIETSLRLDCRKAERELAWRPSTSLEEGIRRTLAWWKAHIGCSNKEFHGKSRPDIGDLR